MTEAIAAAELWWEPGTKMTYHAQTFGFLVGELVRRAIGKPISAVLREEITEPLGIEDELYFGVPAAELHRVGKLNEPDGIQEMLAMMAGMFAKVAPAAVMPTADFGNRADALTADLPSGGTMSARGIAKLYAALLGEVDGVRLLSPERLLEITSPALVATDELMGVRRPGRSAIRSAGWVRARRSRRTRSGCRAWVEVSAGRIGTQGSPSG